MSLRSEKLEKSDLTEFHLLGLEKVDLNKIYRIASEFGRSCKFNFNISDKNKVHNRGYVSFTSFPAEDEERLKVKLQEQGVICQPYVKTAKSTVKIEKFTDEFPKADLKTKI